MTSFYQEKPGIDLEDFRDFVDYMLTERNTYTDVIFTREDGTEYSYLRNQYIPLGPNEEFPDYLFVKSRDGISQDCQADQTDQAAEERPETDDDIEYSSPPPPAPVLTRAHATSVSANGRRMESLFNLEQKIQTYYYLGLVKGQDQYFNLFAFSMKYIFEQGFDIETGILPVYDIEFGYTIEKRWFRLFNPFCENPRCYYSDTSESIINLARFI